MTAPLSPSWLISCLTTSQGERLGQRFMLYMARISLFLSRRHTTAAHFWKIPFPAGLVSTSSMSRVWSSPSRCQTLKVILWYRIWKGTQEDSSPSGPEGVRHSSVGLIFLPFLWEASPGDLQAIREASRARWYPRAAASPPGSPGVCGATPRTCPPARGGVTGDASPRSELRAADLKVRAGSQRIPVLSYRRDPRPCWAVSLSFPDPAVAPKVYEEKIACVLSMGTYKAWINTWLGQETTRAVHSWDFSLPCHLLGPLVPLRVARLCSQAAYIQLPAWVSPALSLSVP
nr:uncharacterized protein LOC112424064 [Macaca nemestrina]